MNFITSKDRIYLEENDNVVAEVRFRKISDNKYDIYYTFVSDSLRGKGIASMLMKRATEYIQDKNCIVEASCSYAKNWIEKNM